MTAGATGRPIRDLTRRLASTGVFRPRLLLLWWTVVVAVAAAAVAVAAFRTSDQTLRVDAAQRRTIDVLERVLLHDSVIPQYARVVNQFDERGFVTGIGDFSTADGGALQVVQTYTARVGGNELARGYLSTLPRLAAAHSGDSSASRTVAAISRSSIGSSAGEPVSSYIASVGRARRARSESIIRRRATVNSQGRKASRSTSLCV
jgi:hypothetical protein